MEVEDATVIPCYGPPKQIGIDLLVQEVDVAITSEGVEALHELASESMQRAFPGQGQLHGPRPGNWFGRLDHHQRIDRPIRDVRDPDASDSFEEGTRADESSIDGLMPQLRAMSRQRVDLGR